MLLPRVWTAAVLGSCCHRAAAQWLLQPRSQRAHSLCAAPAQLALPACLGLQLPLLAGLLGEHWAASSLWSLKCTLCSGGSPTSFFLQAKMLPSEKWERMDLQPWLYKAWGHRRDHSTYWPSQESCWGTEHGWVRAQGYQRQQASSEKSNTAKGHVDSACPLLGQSLTCLCPPLLHLKSTICDIPACWALLWHSSLFLYHISLCT